MDERLRVDADFARAQVAALLAQFPELVEDEELLLSALEGETDFDAVMSRLVDAFLDAVAMKEALASRMSNLRERSARFDRQAKTFKAMMQRLMDASGLLKLSLPEATLSIRQGSQSVEVTDERVLPQGYFVRTPDKTAIKAALKAGEPLPGAKLVTGEPSLSIRTK